MNTQTDYINNNLIAYIGNKRNLIPLIEKAIKKTGILISNPNPQFLDLFAGTGVVSRLAKYLGFAVHTNDWEYYSYIINKAFIELDESFLKTAFTKLGGINTVIKTLNNLSEPKGHSGYISQYYCPVDDNEPDLDNERLFYTNYNGKKIDAVRDKIQEWAIKKVINEKEEFLLLALLLYEASTRSNTSGVFKGFHKGFGGTNGDALTRILKPIEFSIPTLINGEKTAVYNEDALSVSEKFKETYFDIVYIDPPYNQHQYGSNYHLLNTIALNDKPLVNKEIYINGKKTNKSAIRKDWVKTKSTFCYKKTAREDFQKIIANLNTHYILISYSTDGIIDFDDLLKILVQKGKLDICLSEYVRYRGGKQALTSEIKNIEFVLIIDTTKSGSQEDIESIKKTLLINKIKIFFKKTINPIRAESLKFSFKTCNAVNIKNEFMISKKYDLIHLSLGIKNNKIFFWNTEPDFTSVPLETLQLIYDDLEYITNMTKEDEIYLFINEINKYFTQKHYDHIIEIFKNIPYCLSKFNNKKAYIPSLKSLMSILEMMIQTIDVWIDFEIINQTSFKKLEKIILNKLNYLPFAPKKNINKEKNQLNKEQYEYLILVDNYKKQISSLYDYLMTTMEKEANISVVNEYKNQNTVTIDPLIIYRKSHGKLYNRYMM